MVREIGWLVGFEANFWGLVKPIPHQLAMIRVSREIQRTCRFCPPRATASDLLHLHFIACFCLPLSLMLSSNEHSPPNLAFTAILLGGALLRCFLSEECLFPGVLMRRRGPGCRFGIVGVSTAAFSAFAFVHLFF